MSQNNLNYLLRINGMNQAKLAEYLLVTKTSVTLWIQGKTKISKINAMKIAELFNIEVNDIYRDLNTEDKDRLRNIALRRRTVSFLSDVCSTLQLNELEKIEMIEDSLTEYFGKTTALVMKQEEESAK